MPASWEACSATTEAEFRRLLLDKNGTLALGDLLDVPMQGWADLADVDLMSWVSTWWYYRYIGPSTTFYRVSTDWNWWSSMSGSEAAAAYNANLDNAAVNGLIARAITASTEDFDDNWDMYVQRFRDAGLDAYEEDTRASLKANWESNILTRTLR